MIFWSIRGIRRKLNN